MLESIVDNTRTNDFESMTTIESGTEGRNQMLVARPKVRGGLSSRTDLVLVDARWQQGRVLLNLTVVADWLT